MNSDYLNVYTVNPRETTRNILKSKNIKLIKKIKWNKKTFVLKPEKAKREK